MIETTTSTGAFGVRGEGTHFEVVGVQEEIYSGRDKQEIIINRDIENITKSPIDIKVLKRELSYYNHPDKQIIFKGFTEGFSLHYKGPHISSEAKNLKSAFQHPLIVREKINKELALKRVAGPLF